MVCSSLKRSAIIKLVKILLPSHSKASRLGSMRAEVDPNTFNFSENSNHGQENLLEVLGQNIAVRCQQTFDENISVWNSEVNLLYKGQIISECPIEILDFPKIPRKI